MTVVEAYPWVAEAFSVVGEEQHGRYLVCDCPLRCHKSARVRFTVGDNGVLLFKCMRECPKLEMLRAVGASWKDCYPAGTDWKRVKQEEVARYNYRDERGAILYQTVRLEPGRGGRDKEFRQCRPVLDQFGAVRDWLYNLDGVRRVLYRLPELLAAPASEPVWVVAGEKDVETLRALGLVATTNVCGERAEWLDGYSECLAGRDVVVVEDRDTAGRRHLNEVCGSLMGAARSLRRVCFPEKDATAFVCKLRALGITGRTELREYVWGAAEGSPKWRAA